MRLVVTGAKGQLGLELLAILGRDHEVTALGRPEWDLTTADAGKAIADARPAWVVHAAALTDVDGCERDPARALLVNGEGTRRVAEACRAVEAGMLYVSTDYVFDGKKGAPYVETDAPAPVSAYGRSKLVGEEITCTLAPRSAIVRTSWLFGASGKNFVKTILDRARKGDSLRVVDDQIGSPTSARDLAEAMAQLLVRQLTGVYHLTNAGACSWYTFAGGILEAVGLTQTPLSPITTAALNRPAPRPAFSVLDNRAWAAAGMPPLRPWREALAAMLVSQESPASPHLLIPAADA